MTTQAAVTTYKEARHHGQLDARTFAAENPEEIAAALTPGQYGADESLCNSLGLKAVAALFHLDGENDPRFNAACAAYSAAFEAELRKIAKS